MTAVVHELRTEASEIVADLRRLADKIERGDVEATSAFVVARDRVSGIVSTTVCGERMSYSGLMGLLSYANCLLFKQANEG